VSLEVIGSKYQLMDLEVGPIREEVAVIVEEPEDIQLPYSIEFHPALSAIAAKELDI
jgi:hypothetical protein